MSLLCDLYCNGYDAIYLATHCRTEQIKLKLGGKGEMEVAVFLVIVCADGWRGINLLTVYLERGSHRRPICRLSPDWSHLCHVQINI